MLIDSDECRQRQFIVFMRFFFSCTFLYSKPFSTMTPNDYANDDRIETLGNS
jgi:hypothetical protein